MSPEGASPIVLIAGATGLVGRALGLAYVRSGYRVRVLSRRDGEADLPFPVQSFRWEGSAEGLRIPAAALAGVDAVVNLCGESIAVGRWTAARRQALIQSRTQTAAAVSKALAGLPAAVRPKVYVQASAVGFYGNCDDDSVDETAPAGSGFLAEVCKSWELAAAPTPGVRLVKLRIGMVIALEGGALPKLLSVYRKGFGANLGKGRQWVPFIHLHDLVAMIVTATNDERWAGAVNAVTPQTCRYEDLHHALLQGRGGGLDLSVPQAFVRLGLGEQAQMLLQGARAVPRAASNWGFKWTYPSIQGAIEAELGRLVDRKANFLVAQQFVARPLAEVWPFFADERNLEQLTPPWLNFKVKGKSTANMAAGTLIDYQLKLHGLPLHWQTRIDDWTPPTRFIDTQLKGPYALWHHTHSFEELAGGTLMKDLVQFRLPVAPLGGLVAGAWVERDVNKIFAYRRQATIQNIERRSEGAST